MTTPKQADGESPPAIPSARGRLTIGKSFSDRNNSLNFLRLALAATVLVDHAVGLGKFGTDNILNKTSPGLIAVYGFFGISGYLIAASAIRNGVGAYLWRRALRILPGFWICLILTAFVFGLIGWLHQPQNCGISCYLRAPKGPLEFVLNNSWLRSNQNRIANTLNGVPVPLAWNGSTWSLFYEFLCYLVVAGLALSTLLQRRFIVALLAVAVWVTEFVITSVPSLNAKFNVFFNIDVWKMLELLPVFLVGVVLYLYRDKVPDSGVWALGSTGVFLVSLILPLGNHYPAYTITSADLFAPALAYPLLWLGIHLPFRKVGVRNDYSYGVYIYSYPLTQLLALWGAYRWGVVAFTSLAVLITCPFAVASWWLVEKHALRLKNLTLKVVLFGSGPAESARLSPTSQSATVPTR